VQDVSIFNRSDRRTLVLVSFKRFAQVRHFGVVGTRLRTYLLLEVHARWPNVHGLWVRTAIAVQLELEELLRGRRMLRSFYRKIGRSYHVVFGCICVSHVYDVDDGFFGKYTQLSPILPRASFVIRILTAANSTRACDGAASCCILHFLDDIIAYHGIIVKKYVKIII
jgi:hypothetical protein